MKYYRYQIKPIQKLNRYTSELGAREGILFNYNGCFLDYHPWTEFGDLGLDEFLAKIKNEGITKHMRDLFSLDREKKSIVPQPFLNHTFNKVSKCCKLKYSSRNELISFMAKLETGSKLRVDFNNSLSFEQSKDLWNSFTQSQRDLIEFFEDPCPESQDWGQLRKLGMRIACDRNKGISGEFDFRILKPNVDNFLGLENNLIFSSYMGHDLGRYHCYLALMRYGRLDLFHGIDTPDIFENQKNLFTDLGNNLLSLNNTAVRELYSELEELEWTSL